MKDILELARECGAVVTDYGRGHYVATFGEVSLPELERRIREDEREKAAKVCDELHQRQLNTMTEHNYYGIAAAAIRRGGDHG